MRALYITVLLFLVSPILSAAEPLLLRHTLVSTEASATGTTASYRLELINTGTHNLHNIELSLQDVGLSLTWPSATIHFQSLPAGQQKHHSIAIISALSAEQLSAAIMLFHTSSINEFGQRDSYLLRSEVMP